VIDRLDYGMRLAGLTLEQMAIVSAVLVPEAYLPGATPELTRKRPGPGKVAVLIARAERGQTLFRADEPQWTAPPADEEPGPYQDLAALRAADRLEPEPRKHRRRA
jgi:hypothetical protein